MWVVAMCLFFEQKTAYDWRIRDGSSDVCSSDLIGVWAGLIGWDLTPWEARTLVSLSGVFLAEYEQARKGGPAPRREEPTDEEMASVAKGLADLLRRNAKRQKRNGR